MQKKKTRWHKARHNFWWHVMRGLVRVYCRTKYKLKTDKFNNKKRPYLILYNHQTAIDAIMACLAVKKFTYLVCTEDLYTMGSTTAFIHHAVAPIPFKKSMADVSAVRACMRVAKEGYSIALSPEGNRTFDGVTCHINPAIAKLVKALKMPVMFYKVTGGYDVHPRYADKPRKGPKVRGAVSRVLEPEDFADMPVDELYGLIKSELYVDESDSGVEIKSKNRAEHMERALYWCPVCGAVGGIKTKGSEVFCTACNSRSEVDKFSRFKGDFPVYNIKDWLTRQNGWVSALQLERYREEPLSSDGGVNLRRLRFEERDKEVIEENAEVKLFGDRLEIGGLTFGFDDITAVAPCGRNRVDFYFKDDTYQLTREQPLSILKYTNVFYSYKNAKEKNNGFLGI